MRSQVAILLYHFTKILITFSSVIKQKFALPELNSATTNLESIQKSATTLVSRLSSKTSDAETIVVIAFLYFRCICSDLLRGKIVNVA